MGRKVGKHRSKRFTELLRICNLDGLQNAAGLSRYQWNNFNKYVEKTLWELAVRDFRKDKS